MEVIQNGGGGGVQKKERERKGEKVGERQFYENRGKTNTADVGGYKGRRRERKRKELWNQYDQTFICVCMDVAG